MLQIFRCSRSIQPLLFQRSYSSRPSQIRVTKRWPFGLLFLTGTGLAASVYYTSEPKPLPLSVDYFTPLKLIRKEVLNESTSLFVLDVPTSQRPIDNDGKAIKSLHIMQPEISIQRAYTPLDVKGFTNGQLELVIKRYADGEVSKYLHRQNVGDEIRVRGPVQTWFLDPTLDRIVFVRSLFNCLRNPLKLCRLRAGRASHLCINSCSTSTTNQLSNQKSQSSTLLLLQIRFCCAKSSNKP